MDKFSMCRVCLEEDIRLHSIVETHLQEMYESLVLVPFETKDSRPILICYICCARLQNCYEFRKSCLRSEELFTQMLNCEELEPVNLQEYDNKKRLKVFHNVVQLTMGHELQMSADNVGVEALTFDDVKVEKKYPKDIDEDAQEENRVYNNIQSADSDDGLLIIVKEEQSEDKTSDHTRKEFEQAVPRNPENLTSIYLKERKSTNEVTFTLNDNNKERSTSVPHSECVQYTCDTCQQCYSSKCKLERHIRLCSDVWNKDLSRENSTSSHTHTGQIPHQCHVCGKSFSYKSSFAGHMRTHTGEKPYHCDICKKEFSQRGILINHMRTHTGQKPHQCHVCGNSFSRMMNLTSHIHTHTGEKPRRCDVCHKQFSRNRYLTTHMRLHTGEKPYQCTVCKKYFSQVGNLTIHMRTHTGEKPHRCSICKKYFSQSNHLIKHMRTHTGEKPYQCNICNKCFSQLCNLKTHMRTHNKR